MSHVQGFVYFIQAIDGPIKIGFSVDPIIRLRMLQVSHSTKMTLLGTIHGTKQTEKDLHLELHASHIRGEWFRPTAEVLRYVESSMSCAQTTEALNAQTTEALNAKAIAQRSTLSDDTDKVPLLIEASECCDREMIEKAIAQADGNISVAARMLGWARRTMQNKMRKFQIEPGKAGRKPYKVMVRLP